MTHEPDIATYARRIIVLHDGRVATDDRRSAVAPAPTAPTPA